MYSKISKINNFNEYIKFLIEHKSNYLICAAVCDTLYKIDSQKLLLLKELGLDKVICDWIGYVYLSYGNDIRINEASLPKFPISKIITINDIAFNLISKPYQCGCRANIIINNINYSINKRGLNFIIIDIKQMKIIDSVCFDFFPNSRYKFRRELYLTGCKITNQLTQNLYNTIDIDDKIDRIIKKYEINRFYAKYFDSKLSKKIIKNLSLEWENSANIACICVANNPHKCNLDKYNFITSVDSSKRYLVDFYCVVIKDYEIPFYTPVLKHDIYDFTELDYVNFERYDFIYIVSSRYSNYLGIYLKNRNLQFIDLYTIFKSKNCDTSQDYYEFIDDKRESKFFSLNEVSSPYYHEYYYQKNLFENYNSDLKFIHAFNCYFLSIVMKNFILAKKWYYIIFNSRCVFKNSVCDAWKDIEDLLCKIKEALNNRSSEDILAIWIDCVGFDDLCNLPYIYSLKDNSIFFENIFTCTGYTEETFIGIFTGKKLIDDQTYRIDKINKLNSNLLNIIDDFEICIHSRCFSQLLPFEYLIETPFYYDVPASELLWDGIKNILNSTHKTFVLLPIQQTHTPFFNFEINNNSLYNQKLRLIDSYKEVDEQVKFYFDLINKNVKSIIFSDHGSKNQGDRHHTFMLIYGNKIKPARIKHLSSSICFHDILYNIIKINNFISSDPSDRCICIQGISTQSSQMHQNIGPSITNAIPTFCPPFYPYKGFITSDYIYIYYYNGRESFRKRNDIFIPMSWYYRDDDIYDKDELNKFKDKYKLWDIRNSDFGPLSNYYNKMQEIILKNYEVNYLKIKLINELISSIHNKNIYLFSFGNDSVEFLLSLQKYNRDKITSLIIEKNDNDYDIYNNYFNIKRINLKSFNYNNDFIVINPSLKSTDLLQSDKIINIYEYFNEHNLRLKCEFYKFELFVK